MELSKKPSAVSISSFLEGGRFDIVDGMRFGRSVCVRACGWFKGEVLKSVKREGRIWDQTNEYGIGWHGMAWHVRLPQVRPDCQNPKAESSPIPEPVAPENIAIPCPCVLLNQGTCFWIEMNGRHEQMDDNRSKSGYGPNY